MASNWQPELRRTWSAATGAAVRSILLSPRGKVAAATAAALHLYDAPPGFAPRGELRGHPAGLTAAAFSGKGTDVVAGGADGFLKWWQVETGDELCSTQVPTDGSSGGGGDAAGGVGDVACSRAGLVAVASGRLLCIFGSGGEHLHTLTVRPGGAPLRHLAWLDDATVAGCCGTEAILWHVQQDACEEVAAFGTNPAAGITALAVSPSGRYLAAACDNRTVQVWDREREEGGADPALCLADGIDGAVGPLSWDSSSRLLAAAVGSEALVWDVAAAHEGHLDTSYVCIGFEQGSAVTALAFQPNGTLLAVAADNGLCLVFDSAVFGTGSVASGLVTHAASGRLASSSAAAEAEAEGDSAAAAADGGSITALAWHAMGSLLVGTSTGAVSALQPLRATVQRMAAEGHGDAAALRRGQQDPAAKRRPLPSQQQQQQQQQQHTGADAPAYAPQLSAPKPAGGPAGGPRVGAQPAGWGGEPLMTNGVAGPAGGVDGYSAPPLGAGRGGRGRGIRGGPAGGRYGPGGPQAYGMQQQQQPYVKRDAAGAGAGGPPKLPSAAMAPQAAAGAVTPEQQASMMVATQWGMMPAAMWRQMGVGYAMNPYGQMVPMAAGMAPAMPGYPAAMAQPMPPAPPGGGRGAPYAPRPGMGGPSGGRGGGRGAPMGGNGSQGADAGGGGRGMGAGAAPYARRPGPPGSASDRPSRSDSASPQQPYAQQPPPPPPLPAGREEREGSLPVQQHAPHDQQQQQQERPARGPSLAAQQRPAYGGGRGAGAAAGDGVSSNGSGGGAGGAYHHAQPQAPPPPPAPPAGGAPPLSPAQAMAPGAAVMARPPYGMAPVYMFPQPGMMPAWGMYPGQMAAFPAPGGYVMYPAGAYGAPAGAAPAAALAPQLSGGADGGDGGGGGRRNGGGGGGGGGDRGGYSGYAAASEDGEYHGGGGGGYARSSGYGGGAPTGPLFTLYVGNLAPSVDEAALSAQFEQFGPVERAQIIRDRETQEPRGYGFLTFSASAPGAAQAAMARLNNTALPGPFAGRIVRVSPSNKWRTAGGGGGDAA